MEHREVMFTCSVGKRLTLETDIRVHSVFYKNIAFQADN